MSDEVPSDPERWEIVERPGYFGSRKSALEAMWNAIYGFNEKGERNWKIGWESATGEPLSFERIFVEYVRGYTKHLREHPEVLAYLVNNASYIYDIDPDITKEQAFNPTALVGMPGIPNQFHHVAINIAIERVLGIAFRCKTPMQTRGLKRAMPIADWPIPALLQPGVFT